MIEQDDINTLEDFCIDRDITPSEAVHELIENYLEDLAYLYPVHTDNEGIRADMRYERLVDERLGI
jgi:hypothetical protein